MTENENIAQLIFKSLEGNITEQEKMQLASWVAANQANKELFNDLNIEDTLAAAIAEYHPDNRTETKTRIWEMIKDQSKLSKKPPVVSIQRRSFSRVAVAASILLTICISSYFLFFNKKDKQTEIVKVPENSNDVKAPDNNRAIITLANGKQVYLDSIQNGQLFKEGNVKVVKLAKGQIVYENDNGEIVKEPEYNTLINPRGSTVIDMTLADGSRVWLNAGSSVTYPVFFTGKERKVIITGEAYFEVAHNPQQPFKVRKGDVEVTVLGTHFNVNAYDDEPDLKITLLKGSVKVNQGNVNALLIPGQQAQVTNQINVAAKVDLDEVIAWKEGYFKFNRADIKIIMRQLARWYDLEIQYEANIPLREFGGEMERDLPLSSMLRLLEKGKFNIKVEGKKLIVKR